VTYQISKEFAFSAGHRLSGLKPNHPCARVHGHNYVVVVELEAYRLDSIGFVRDYGELKWFKDYVDTHFDHRWLGSGALVSGVVNDDGSTTATLSDDPLAISRPVTDFNPTAENLAYAFWSEVTQHYTTRVSPFHISVGVSETPKTMAWYRPGQAAAL
jgi:6-pyruvoyltetrahydropterin/6-carboxytetrahydropterin synthase